LSLIFEDQIIFYDDCYDERLTSATNRQATCIDVEAVVNRLHGVPNVFGKRTNDLPHTRPLAHSLTTWPMASLPQQSFLIDLVA